MTVLLMRSRQVLLMNQQQLADLARSSLRTVQRWETKRSFPHADSLHLIADAVRLHDVALASELDEYAPRPRAPVPAPIAASVAPVTPPATPSPPRAAQIPIYVLVDSVVCAAAEAMSVAPRAIRPAILAAFERARAAELTFDDVLAELTRPLSSTAGMGEG